MPVHTHGAAAAHQRTARSERCGTVVCGIPLSSLRGRLRTAVLSALRSAKQHASTCSLTCLAGPCTVQAEWPSLRKGQKPANGTPSVPPGCRKACPVRAFRSSVYGGHAVPQGCLQGTSFALCAELTNLASFSSCLTWASSSDTCSSAFAFAAAILELSAAREATRSVCVDRSFWHRHADVTSSAAAYACRPVCSCHSPAVGVSACVWAFCASPAAMGC